MLQRGKDNSLGRGRGRVLTDAGRVIFSTQSHTTACGPAGAHKRRQQSDAGSADWDRRTGMVLARPGREGWATLPRTLPAAAMNAYVIRRLLALLPTLFFASLIVFASIRLIPGDVIDLMLSQNDVGADQLTRDQLVAALGLDKPMLTQYFDWIGAILLHADFGRSLWHSTPVLDLLLQRLPVTFELGFLALVIGLLVAIPVGVYSAIRQDTAGDYLTRSAAILMLAVPSFWLGTMAMVLPSIWWGWAPDVDFVPFFQDPVRNLKQMLLPAVILGTSLSAITMRMMRTMMLEVLRQDYIRT